MLRSSSDAAKAAVAKAKQDADETAVLEKARIEDFNLIIDDNQEGQEEGMHGYGLNTKP